MTKKKQKELSIEELEAKFTVQSARIIQDAIHVAAALQKVAQMEPCDILTSMVIAIGNEIIAYCMATGEKTEEIQKTFCDCLNEHISGMLEAKTKE